MTAWVLVLRWHKCEYDSFTEIATLRCSKREVTGKPVMSDRWLPHPDDRCRHDGCQS